MTAREPSDGDGLRDLIDTLSEDLNRRLDEILTNQTRGWDRLIQHESRIAVLEARTPSNPSNYVSRLSVLEESIPDQLPSRLGVLEKLVPHKLSERLRSLEDFKDNSVRAWSRWQTNVNTIVEFVILGVLGWVIFGKPPGSP